MKHRTFNAQHPTLNALARWEWGGRWELERFQKYRSHQKGIGSRTARQRLGLRQPLPLFPDSHWAKHPVFGIFGLFSA